MDSKSPVSGSTILLGNAALSMSCILLIYAGSDKALGVYQTISLALLSVATPLLVGQYFMQFVFSGYKGNILLTVFSVALSIAAYCSLVWSIRWWAGAVFTLTSWWYFTFAVRRVYRVLASHAGGKATADGATEASGTNRVGRSLP